MHTVLKLKENTMIEIDGSYGEGGGQILRSSLSLAALTGKSVRFSKIRAKRRKPGLMRQHLTCAKAVSEITKGILESAELNSQELIFTPGKITGGDYHFTVGSAGSTLLVAQTILPILLHAEQSSHVVIDGGTHAAGAPVFEYFKQVFLKNLAEMGANIEATIERVGFYPAGGGRIVLDITPIKEWKHLEIMEKGSFKKGRIVAASHGISSKIRDDELLICRNKLAGSDMFDYQSLEFDSPGSGNVMFAEVEYENMRELFSACGSFDVSRKNVAERVAKMVNDYQSSDVPVWRFLADQLLLPMAIGNGGRFLTVAPSEHTLTNIEVIRKFMTLEIKLENKRENQYIIEVKK